MSSSHKTKKRIKVSSAKAKGRSLQKWTCSKISEVTGIEWGKDCPIESRPMGQTGVDVRMEKRVLKIFPFSIECKRQETWSVHEWIKQAKDNQLEKTDWLLIVRKSGEKPIVILDGEVFFKLQQEIVNLKQAKSTLE